MYGIPDSVRTKEVSVMLRLLHRRLNIHLALALCLAVSLTAISGVPAQAGTRIALLLGNGDYQLPGMDLANPINDVVALKDTLGGLGFETRAIQNGSRNDMNDALTWFETAAQNAEMALVFYAGHGVQFNGENYLLSSDLDGLTPALMTNSSLRLSRVKAAIDRAAPDIGIIILDACRNNPFQDSDWAEDGLAVASGGQGLLIAYATDPGNVAYDGTGENSAFTTALLDNIETDGLDVRLMFGRVRQQVVRQTGGAQIPWVEESVLGEHYFGAAAATVAPIANDELVLWRQIADSTEPADFTEYLAEYPDGLFASFAQARIDYLSNPEPYQPITGDRSSAVVLADANPNRVATSLGLLGYLPQTRGLTPVQSELLDAFDAYRATLPDPQLASLDQLHTDAARLTVFLAAATGQKIRTDITALGSIERTFTVADDAYKQMVAVAGDNEDYKPLIDAAKADVDAIVASKDAVQSRLDASRSYYDSLVLKAQDNYGVLISPTLLTGKSASRAVGSVTAQLQNDAALFIKHVELQSNRTRGSYAWMIDFIQKS